MLATVLSEIKMRDEEEKMLKGVKEGYSAVIIALAYLKAERHSHEETAFLEEGIKEIRFKKVRDKLGEALDLVLSCLEEEK